MGIVLILIGVVEFVFVLYLDKFTIERYKTYKWVAIIYLIFVLLSVIALNNISYIKDKLYNSSEVICDQMVLMLLGMSFSLMCSSVFVAFIQKLHERSIIKKKEQNFEYPDYEYYREIIKDVSPAILSYCYNRRINVEDDVVAVLLSLELKGIIKIEDNKVVVLKDTKKLLFHEKLVLEKIEIGRYNDRYFKKVFKSDLRKDMIGKGYVKLIDGEKANVTYFIEIIMCWLIIYMLSTLAIFVKFSSLGLWLLLSYFLTFACLPAYKFIQSKINVLVRSGKSIDLGVKMGGLKNYIKDFSNINKNSPDMIKLFEEYVIYAIVLNLKGKLNNECKKIYDKTRLMRIYNANIDDKK